MTIERKIRNKERCAYRGRKMRYSVWRARYNQVWEEVYEKMSRRICSDHNLVLDDHISEEPRNTWNHTYRDLREKGYNMIGTSIRNMMRDMDEIAEKQEQEMR